MYMELLFFFQLEGLGNLATSIKRVWMVEDWFLMVFALSAILISSLIFFGPLFLACCLALVLLHILFKKTAFHLVSSMSPRSFPRSANAQIHASHWTTDRWASGFVNAQR